MFLKQINIFKIIKYFVLCIILSYLSFYLKGIVMSAILSSPTGVIGNNFISLSEVHNTGAAFNLFADNTQGIISASTITVASITLLVLLFSKKLSNAVIINLAILTSGIIMNLIERINQGYVIDYIHLNFINNIPVFNFPDIMIVLGAFGIILAIFIKE